MHVPVVVNGKAMEWQFDTGADESIIYGRQATSLGWAAAEARKFVARTVSIGGATLQRPEVYVLKDQGETGGTVGLSFLTGKVTLIDYPRQLLCVLNPADVPVDLTARVKWTNSILRNAKLWVPIKIGGRGYERLFFDTGASLFPMKTDVALWRELTGLADATAAPSTISGTQWGQKRKWPGAPAAANVELGPIKIASPLVYTDPTEPNHFEKMGLGAQGLIGNALVWDRIVLIWMTHRVRFGIVE